MISEHEPVILSWDWREQPDLDELAKAVLEMSGGTVHIHAVETHSDQYAIVLADTELDDAVVAETYRRWYYEDEEG